MTVGSRVYSTFENNFRNKHKFTGFSGVDGLVVFTIAPSIVFEKPAIVFEMSTKIG